MAKTLPDRIAIKRQLSWRTYLFIYLYNANK